jgi:hypothetical protein
VIEEATPRGARYVIHPRLASDYYFVGDEAVYTSWGRLKESFR